MWHEITAFEKHIRHETFFEVENMEENEFCVKNMKLSPFYEN